jgi:hypothetical protein
MRDELDVLYEFSSDEFVDLVLQKTEVVAIKNPNLAYPVHSHELYLSLNI